MTGTGHRHYWTVDVKYPKAQTLIVPGDDARQAALWAAWELHITGASYERGAGRNEWFVFVKDHPVARLIITKKKEAQP